MSDQGVLEQMKQKIERMNKQRQLEVLQIIHKKKHPISENKNGTWINMSVFSEETLEELRKYIAYVDDQESLLNAMETEKTELIKHFFEE